MKIYTRTGDKGKTTLVGGTPVLKTHIRIEAYGSVDELMAQIALLYDMMNGMHEIKEKLMRIQDRLMTCSAILAADCEDCGVMIPSMNDEDSTELEKWIDEMELSLSPLHSFILPGGHLVSSQCHVARTVCRRSERQIIALAGKLFVPDTVIKYVNRLSDYLFVLSRKLLHDSGKKDIPWKPEL